MVAVEDPVPDHRIPPHPQREAGTIAPQDGRHLEALGHLHRLDRPAGHDRPGERDLAGGRPVPQANPAPQAPHGLDEARLDERVNVLVERSPGAQPKPAADLVEGRGASPPAPMLLEPGEHVGLAAGVR